MNRILTGVMLLLIISASRPCRAQSETPAERPDPQRVIVKLFGAGVGNLDSYGTGVLVSKTGHVITVANHLVSTGFLTAVTWNGRRYAAETIATSTEFDVALLKLKSDPADEFSFTDLAQAKDVDQGTPVLAYSNMFRVAAGNEPVSVVHAVISASIPLEASQGRWKFPLKSPVWLIDAITNNSGAAGGLLVDESGAPVGLIGREIRHASSRTWVNYAVPMTALKPVVTAMLEGRQTVTAARSTESAAMLTDQEITTRYGLTLLPGVVERTPAYVDAVVPESPAARAGFRRGDLILLIGDAVITSVTDVQQRMAEFRPGQKMTFTVDRDQQLQPLELTAGQGGTGGGNKP